MHIVTRILITSLILASQTQGASADESNGWPHYGGGTHGRQYAAVGQIDPGNVSNLREVWRYRTGEMSEGYRRGFSFQANPILAEGLLYLPTGSAIIIALDPASGEEVWRYDPQLDRSKNHSETANRGVSSWIDPEANIDALCRHTIFVGTLDARLIAVDGATGKPCSRFAMGGQLRLDRDVGAEEDDWINYLVTSPPVIVNGVVVVGSAIGDNRSVESELGIVRGIDARSGREVWRWDPIPRSKEDPAWASWESEQALKNGSANAWAPLAADTERGIVYVPTGSASPDFFGGERLGDNLYANSLVAIDAATGARLWHQQLVHHDVWDYDLASQPTLVELSVDGETVPAVIQGTKTGMIFTFNRVTGEPLFDIEERPVPQGAVDGEQLSPTQPFPVAPPPLVNHDPVSEDEAFGMLWFDTRSCRNRIRELRSEGIFTPPDPRGTLMRPGYAGGINWGGIAFHPEQQVAVAFAMDLAMEVALIPRDDLREVYESGDYEDYEFARQSGTPFGMRRSALLSPARNALSAASLGHAVRSRHARRDDNVAGTAGYD